MDSEQKLDYLGFIISWPRNRVRSDRWQVNLSSDSPHLMAMLGGQAKVFADFKSLESAIQKAQQDVDELLLA
jgi:hypothetical protein